eukprot:1382289-Pleurochrysis_carterae.AAC.1
MPASPPPQQYLPIAIKFLLIAGDTLAYTCFARVWLRMYGVTFLAVGKFMRVGLPPVLIDCLPN